MVRYGPEKRKRRRLPGAQSLLYIADLADIGVSANPHASIGHVAEWLRNGLQNRVPRFNSGRGLQHPAAFRPGGDADAALKFCRAFVIRAST